MGGNTPDEEEGGVLLSPSPQPVLEETEFRYEEVHSEDGIKQDSNR